MFNIDDWKIIGEYVHDSEGGRHQAFYSPKRDIKCLGVCFKEGERVQVEQSLKYSHEESQVLWQLAGLKEIGKWTAAGESYSKSNICLLSPKKCDILACHTAVKVIDS
jgi:L-histidine Nalpha-methyltransferase / hercynylcysteine S-oxide synthase